MNFNDLEHQSGLRPLGEYPDHCERCRHISSCGHEDITAIKVWSGGTVMSFCAGCGLTMTEPASP